MKEINMTKAISCMPDKFITMEMVELANKVSTLVKFLYGAGGFIAGWLC